MAEEKGFQIIEPPVKTEAVAPTLTAEDAKAAGWKSEEIKSAEERGLLKKPDAEPEKKEEEKKEEKKDDGSAPEGKGGEEGGEDEKENKPPAEAKKAPAVEDLPEPTPTPAATGIPEMKFSEEEQSLIDEKFGKGHKLSGFYHGMKRERKSRQTAEAKNVELEARIKALEAKPAAPVELPVDTEGNPIDPMKQPLTMESLTKYQADQEKAYKAEQDKQLARAQAVASAGAEQESYVKSIHDDYEVAVKLAIELKDNIDTLVPEKHKQMELRRMFGELQTAAATADKFQIDENHSAFIAYEIGQMHPKYGHPAEPAGDPKDPKVNGRHSPEQMERIKKNTERRGSSAAVPGGGGGKVTAEKIDLAAYSSMPAAERLRFKEQHPDLHKKLVS